MDGSPDVHGRWVQRWEVACTQSVGADAGEQPHGHNRGVQAWVGVQMCTVPGCRCEVGAKTSGCLHPLWSAGVWMGRVGAVTRVGFSAWCQARSWFGAGSRAVLSWSRDWIQVQGWGLVQGSIHVHVHVYTRCQVSALSLCPHLSFLSCAGSKSWLLHRCWGCAGAGSVSRIGVTSGSSTGAGSRSVSVPRSGPAPGQGWVLVLLGPGLGAGPLLGARSRSQVPVLAVLVPVPMRVGAVSVPVPVPVWSGRNGAGASAGQGGPGRRSQRWSGQSRCWCWSGWCWSQCGSGRYRCQSGPCWSRCGSGRFRLLVLVQVGAGSVLVPVRAVLVPVQVGADTDTGAGRGGTGAGQGGASAGPGADAG